MFTSGPYEPVVGINGQTAGFFIPALGYPNITAAVDDHAPAPR